MENFVQIFQLPIIALIILFSITIIKKSENKKILSNPFGYIFYGFCTNFIYILHHSLLNFYNIKYEFYFINSLKLEFLLDVFVSYFFLRESFRETKKIDIPIINYLPELVTLFLLPVVFIQEDKSIDKILSLYNVTVYAILCNYLWKKRKKERKQEKGFFINNYIFYGFIIWAIIQIIPLFFDTATINLLGFSISAFSKGLILYGLYNYSINLEGSLKEFQNIKLKSLQKIINEISNSNNIDELELKVCEHFVNIKNNNKVFNFDYVILSEVDYLVNKIRYKKSIIIEKKLIENQSENLTSIDVSFDSNNILEIIRKNLKSYNINGYSCNGTKVDISEYNQIFNTMVFKSYKDINRIIFPLFNSKRNKRAIAVIELGYHKINNDDDLLFLMDSELDLYLDNLSQTYEKLLHLELKNEIDKCKKNAALKSGDNQNDYLKYLLEDFLKVIKCSYGFIYIKNSISIDLEVIERELILPKNNTLNKKFQHLKSIIKRFNLQNLRGSDKNLLYKELKNLYGFNNIIIDEVKFGMKNSVHLFILNVDSNDFFENFKSYLKLYDVESIRKTYHEKKFHYYLTKVVDTGSSIFDLDINIEPMFNIIKNYFSSISITLLERKDNNSFFIKHSNSKYYSTYKESLKDFNYHVNDSVFLHDDQFKLNQINFKNDLIIKNPDMSKVIPLKILNKTQGILILEFDFEPIFTSEDDNFLIIISNKLTSLLQVHKLIESYNQIYDSVIRKDLKDTLKTITEKAMNILNADPVIMFESKDEVNVLFENVTFSHIENFKDNNILNVFNNKPKKNVELAEIIIQTETKYFSSFYEYNDFIKEHLKVHDREDFNNDFWNREEIKSLAAVKLISKIGQQKAIGVLFINFRREVNFTADIKRLIESFASLASIAMTNMVILDKNEKYLLDNMRLSKPIIEEFLAAGLLHNAAKSNSSIKILAEQIIKWNTELKDLALKNKLTTINRKFTLLKSLNEELQSQFQKIQSIYNPKKTIYSKNVNLLKVIQEVADIVSSDFKHLFILPKILNKEAVYIDCDETQIEMSLKNLIKNAFEAMKPRDEIIIEIKEEIETVIISITDSGKKIHDEDIHQIFNIYWTNKVNGSGLGLPISKYFIEKNHNGRLYLKQTEKFKNFIIELPKKIISYD